MRRRRQQVQADHAAVGMSDDDDALCALRVQRLEQVGHVPLDRPGGVPGRAPVAAQVDREPAPLGEGLLSKPAITLAVGGDAVDRERRRPVGRAIMVEVENSHGCSLRGRA